MNCGIFGVAHCAQRPVGFVMPGPLRGVRMDTTAILRARWLSEANRLTMYRRQRATIHCDQTRSLEDIVADAEDLDRCIFLTLALMDEIEDEWLATRTVHV